MMPLKRAIAITAIATGLSQCAPGFGQGSQTLRAAPPSGALTHSQEVAIHHLRWPQSSEAMTKRFGSPAGISRSYTSSRYHHHYPTKSGPVAVEYRWDGVAVGLVTEGL
jgi:hypothetical protein